MKAFLTIIGIVLIVAIPVGILALTIYGLVLGFMAGVLVGILHLVITPLSFVTGFAAFFLDKDLSGAIAVIISNL